MTVLTSRKHNKPIYVVDLLMWACQSSKHTETWVLAPELKYVDADVNVTYYCHKDGRVKTPGRGRVTVFPKDKARKLFRES